MTAQGLREFSETYFGEHGGYAQQYLFHHTRMASRKSRNSKRSLDSESACSPGQCGPFGVPGRE